MSDRYVVEEIKGERPFESRWYVRDTDLGYCTEPTRYHWEARREAQRMNRSPEGHGNSRPPIRTMTRRELLTEGWVESTDPTAVPPAVGDEAVVTARGDLRLGLISKIGRTTIYVDVATPTSPDLITKGRIGGRWQERGYLRSTVPYVPCGNVFAGSTYEREGVGTRCWLRAFHTGSHEGPRPAGSRSYGHLTWRTEEVKA